MIVSPTGTLVDTNMAASAAVCQQTMFNSCQDPSSVGGYSITFDRNVRGYAFQVTQDATTVANWNQPAIFIIRQADAMTSNYKASVYAWSVAATPVSLSRGFTITGYAK